MTNGVLAGLNGLDYAILAIVVVSALHGLTRGALRMLTSILSLVLGIYTASIYYGQAATLARRYLATSPTASAIVGYAVIFIAVFLLIEMAGNRIIQLIRIVHLSWLDRLGGAIVGTLIGVVLAGLIVVAMTAALPAESPVLVKSELAPQVASYNHELLGFVPAQVEHMYQQKRAELFRDWAAAETESPAPSPSPAK
ncbi:MAG TPA: CvpA family protein [Candidatus Binataceae bacterium]|nr:CvpA family protein [Candidatus Binataceae bacterium]